MLNIAMIHPLTADFAANVQGRTPDTHAPHPASRRHGSLAARLVHPVAVWFRRQALTARLDDLDDRLLADIGLQRADIPAVVARAHPWTAPAKAAPAPVAVRAGAARPAPANDAPVNDEDATVRAA